VVITILILVIMFALYRMQVFLGNGGTQLPNRLQGKQPEFQAEHLESVLELDTPPGNVAVARDGRVVFNFHPEYSHPSGAKIAQCKPISLPHLTPPLDRPLCSEWTKHPATEHVSSVLSVRIDSQDRLWLLDFNNHAFVGRAALVMFELDMTGGENDVFKYRHEFGVDVAPRGSFLNDFQISPDGEWIYVADTALVGSILGVAAPALLVYHVPTRTTRRVLSGHPSMLVDNSLLMTVRDKAGAFPQKLGPFTMRIGVDSIALDRQGKFLYYGAVTSGTLYRIDTEMLRNADKGDTELAQAVEVSSSSWRN
jgi:hypothetical protein